MVDVFRPSPEAVEITKQAIEKKVTYIWLQLGIKNEEAKKLLKQTE
jgi:predicted CoA-binding protein